MSWQKGMSFSKCSHLEAKHVIRSNFAIKEMKSRTVISDKQNLEKTFQMGFMHLKIKINENKIQTENKNH